PPRARPVTVAPGPRAPRPRPWRRRHRASTRRRKTAMATPTVNQVMMHQVVVAGEGGPYEEMVQVLGRVDVSAVPVIDRQRRVIGVASETDLMIRVEFAD